MASVSCEVCGHEAAPDEAECMRCGALLARQAGQPATAEPVADRDRPVVEPVPTGRVAPPRCPHCDADVPDPGNLACVECLQMFPDAAPSPPVPERSPHDGTRRDDRPGPSLQIRFDAGGEELGRLDVAAGDAIVVGRHPELPAAQLVGPWDNVSRVHARIGLDTDGAAWVQDEYSTNGTTVNDTALAAGRRAVLHDGDGLRFGATVSAVVRWTAGDRR